MNENTIPQSENSLQDTIERCKRMPLALEGLSPSELMNMVEDALSDLSTWLHENFPQARAKLDAYDTLNIYYLRDGEKNYRDMGAAITAICTAWDVSMFPATVEDGKG